jgi:preprotein translocase subunit SecD
MISIWRTALFSMIMITSLPAQIDEAAWSQFENLLLAKAPQGRRIAVGQLRNLPNQTKYRTYILHQQPCLSVEHVRDAKVVMDKQHFMPNVSIEFTEAGAKIFEDFTASHVGSRVAIVLEGQVQSAPVIKERIPGGRALITLGNMRAHADMKQEAEQLALVLRSGDLPAHLKILEETASPTGTRLTLEYSLQAVVERQADSIAASFENALKKNSIPFERVRRNPGTAMIEIKLARLKDTQNILGWVKDPPFELLASNPATDPTTVVLEFRPEQLEKIRLATEQTVMNTLKRRLYDADAEDVTIKLVKEQKLVVVVPPRPDLNAIKSILTRSGHLEFVEVDDKNDYFKKLKDNLPLGVSSDTYGYQGPDNLPVVEHYILAEKDKLLDYLMNVPKIKIWLAVHEIDKVTSKKIIDLVRSNKAYAKRKLIRKWLTGVSQTISLEKGNIK